MLGQFPEVVDFEYDEEIGISENFSNLVEQQLELDKWSSNDPCLTFKTTHFIMIHFDVDCDEMKIASVMYLLYWFMKEFNHVLPGDRKLEVIQTLG